MTFLAALAILAVGGGAALASDYYGDSPSKDGDKPAARSQKPGAKPQRPHGPKWQAFKQLGQSRLALAAYATGEAEVEAEGEDAGELDAGDPEGKGSINFLLAQDTICYGFILRGTDAPTAVHIHRGLAGENGPVVVEFANVPKDASGAASGDTGTSSGCKTGQTPEETDALSDTLSNIRQNPDRYYVNIHTDAFENGAVRGQLARVWFDNDPAK